MYKIILGLIVLVLLIAPLFSYSQGQGKATDKIIKQFNTIVNWIYTIFFGVAFISIVISGYYFVTAGGDPTKITTAKNFLLWAIIGIVVVSMALGLIKWIEKILTP